MSMKKKTKVDKRNYPVYSRSLVLGYVCPETQESVEVEISTNYVTITGGCDGNHFAGNYCYCPTPEALIYVECPSCGGSHPYTF